MITLYMCMHVVLCIFTVNRMGTCQSLFCKVLTVHYDLHNPSLITNDKRLLTIVYVCSNLICMCLEIIAILQNITRQNRDFCVYRSNASYRLKHRIDLKDLWVCGFENDDDEAEDEDTDVDLRTSIVLAWSASLSLVSFW